MHFMEHCLVFLGLEVQSYLIFSSCLFFLSQLDFHLRSMSSEDSLKLLEVTWPCTLMNCPVLSRECSEMGLLEISMHAHRVGHSTEQTEVGIIQSTVEYCTEYRVQSTEGVCLQGAVGAV